MQQLFAVVFVLLLLWGAVLFLRKKRIAIWNAPHRKQAAALEQLDRMRLTPQHSIHLLRVFDADRGDRRLLIAVHPQGVTVLEESLRQSGHAALKGSAGS